MWSARQIVVEAKDRYNVNLFRGYMENYVQGADNKLGQFLKQDI
jgi:hypothetical protein